MSATVREQWIEELRSGKYNQGQYRLKRETDSGPLYCCLGVLCQVLRLEETPYESEELYGYRDGDEAGVIEFAGMIGTVPDEASKAAGMTQAEAHRLASLNDSGRFSFDLLANVIEDGKILETHAGRLVSIDEVWMS